MTERVLGLIFTRGMTLKKWRDTGLLEREKALYEGHLTRGNFDKIFWFTYGSEDRNIADELKCAGNFHHNICVVAMPSIFKLPLIGNGLYSLVLPFINGRAFRNCSIIKTNQMDGSWSAVIAAKIYGKKLVIRTGYTLSVFGKKRGVSALRRFIFWVVEKFAYRHADLCTVASSEDRLYLINRYRIPFEKIFLLPNYIDTSIFSPSSVRVQENHEVVFVGRLDHQKNLFSLIEAFRGSDLKLSLYGDGELMGALKSYSKPMKDNIVFKGVVPNSQLPDILNSYTYFILVSYFEGMPKTLLEAMACGCICIGSNVSGINEVLEDGVNGYLAQSNDANGIANALSRAMMCENFVSVQERARRTIVDNFSLKEIIDNEAKLFKDLLDMEKN